MTLYEIPTEHTETAHLDEDCTALQQTDSEPVILPPAAAVGYDECGHCFGADDDLADYLPERDDGWPLICPSCGKRLHEGTEQGWQRSPQGRPVCPGCDRIPPAYELERRDVRA